MNILVAIDNNIVEELKVMLQSIKINNDCDLNIYLAYNDLTKKNISKLKKYVEKEKLGNITFFYVECNFNIKENLKHITPTTYIRLFAPFYLDAEIDKILYLDYDIICTGSIIDFYNTDFSNKTIVGCPDFYLYNKSPNYINAGVLLINLKKYREITNVEVITKYINDNYDDLAYQDQDVINNLFVDEILLADTTYNYQINTVNEEYDYAKLIHYESPEKPWLESYNQPIKAIPYYNLLAKLGEKERAKQLSIKHFKNEYETYYSNNQDKSKSLDIIIPSYNATKTVGKTIDSIIDQKLDGIKITVYLIDDASSEDYKPIVEQYKDKVPLKYFRMAKNSGVALARQKGIDEGTGDYFTIIDSDDYFISSYAIQTMYNEIVKSKADVLRTVFAEDYNIEYDFYRLYRHDNIACHGKMYRKKFILDHKITYLDMRGNEDTAYNALLKACDAKYYDLNVLTYRWNYNKDSFTRKNKYYHEIDLMTFAHGFVWTTEEIYKRKKYINNIENKIAELIGWIYSRINDCWYDDTKNKMYEDVAKIYFIYRLITGESIVPKIEKYLNLNDNYDLYFNFLSRVEDEMFNLDEYKKLSKKEKKKLSQLFLKEEKINNKTINTLSELKSKYNLKKDVNIEFPIQLENYNGNLFVSDNVHISSNLTIEGDSDIVIGKNTIIQKNVKIITNGNIYNPKLRKYIYTNSVNIGENVFIGRDVLISPGVKIGNNSYIESGSVVFNSIEENSIAKGNPCTVFSKIDDFDDLFYNEDKKINWKEIEE